MGAVVAPIADKTPYERRIIMELTIGSTLHGFTVNARDDLPELDGVAIQGVHGQSGARLLYLKNDDSNKSFAIGFRTPPNDDTGVFHILEHSVLCGSRRFPVKEPFVDLLKSSMQTFLNAMTFDDKTLYPVASTNEQDLFNLMDVYLDAVFHPNIFEKRQTFEQEGWHYELMANEASDPEANPAALPAEDTTLVYNGVVYNEMKGALSDASSVLYDKLQELLFPGTCYAFESGGTPEGIPTLTYEGYLDEHRRHYRTDNSYIILYGNVNIDRALKFLDERYLTPVAAEQRERDEERVAQGLEPLLPRTIELAQPTRDQARVVMKTAPENACSAVGYVIGTSRDRMRVTATDILLDALLGSNESPLKRALLDAGIAHDVHAFVADGILQPFAVVQLQMPAEGVGHTLGDVLKRESLKLLENGFDRSLVEAALSHEEFQMREHDFGVADGVMHAMTALSGWLYDDAAATDYLRYEDLFVELREKLEQGYFEELLRSLFCECEHVASVVVEPQPDKPDETLKALAALNGQLLPADRERIVAEEELLREMQEAPDSPEAQATLPRLSIADIDEAPAEPVYELQANTSLACVRHFIPARGIAYVYRFYGLEGVSFQELPYVTILTQVLGKLDTAQHTAVEIDTLTQGKLGSLTFFTDIYEYREDPSVFLPKFVVGSSALSDNVEWLASLPREIMLETDFSDTGKILDVLKQRKIGMERAFANQGHSCATTRVKSYYARSGVVREQLGNVGFYEFLCDLIDHFDERAHQLSTQLSELAKRIFCDDRCVVSFTGSDADFERFWACKPESGLVSDGSNALVVPEPQVKNEAFIVPSDVCYAALGWDRRLLNSPQTGVWAVVSRALSYDYLWNEVRVKGGAYGVGFQTLRSGSARFYSYRDPHLDETLERFRQSSEWLAQFDPSVEDLEGFVVATVAKIDAPVKPRERARRQMSYFFSKYEREERVGLRNQVISTTVQDMRALAPVVADVVAKQAVCVFGNREILENAQADLNIVTLVG